MEPKTGIKLISILFLMLFPTACSVRPKPIAYGSDGCHFCSMTIVDRQHASQFVTAKGKAYTFDAIECMMNHVKDMDDQKIALFLVNDYNRPGELTDATTATYLISKGIPSPMGEFLTAFANREDAEHAQAGNQGTLLDWKALQDRFKD